MKYDKLIFKIILIINKKLLIIFLHPLLHDHDTPNATLIDDHHGYDHVPHVCGRDRVHLSCDHDFHVCDHDCAYDHELHDCEMSVHASLL